MKANLKKLFALALALVLIMSTVAGCNTEKPVETQPKETQGTNKPQETTAPQPTEEQLEPVTLKWYLNAAEMEGSEDVEEAFNAKLAEVLPNTTVDFVYVESYGKNWPLFMSGEEKIDIAWGGYETPFLQDTMDGNLMALTDLAEKYAPNIMAEWEIWPSEYSTAVYEGELYGIPCIQPLVNEAQRFHIGEQFLKYIDIDALNAELRKDRKMTAAKLDIIEDAIEAAIADGTFKVGATDWNCMGNLNFAAMGYMPIGASSYNLWFDPEAEKPVAMHLWELPEAKMLLDRFAEWADRGWYTDTLILGQHTDKSEWIFRFVNSWSTNWANMDENGLYYVTYGQNSTTANYYQMPSNLPSEGYIGLTNYGANSTYTVIPYTAENPERAMMLINLIHDEPGTVGNDLFNLICYGFEQNSEEAAKYGWFNYTAVEKDGQIETDFTTRGDAASKHGLYNWMMGNTFKCYHDGATETTAAARAYAMKYQTEVFPTIKKTALAGATILFEDVVDQAANVKAIFTEYEAQLNFGGGGVKTATDLYNSVMNKMYDAGLTEIKASVQAQIDAYVGK